MNDLRDSRPNNSPAPASILIVDDVSRNIQVLARVLDDDGYLVAAAASGKQALAMIPSVVPDLVLLDVMMPELDGFEVCRRIKASTQTSQIPVILLTARTDPEDILTGMKAGAVDYITKPFNRNELMARVRTHVLLKKARDKRGQLIDELRDALARVRKLSGLLPICPYCKKVRSDQGYWQRVEEYVTEQCDAYFSHSICPECVTKHYGHILASRNGQNPDRQEPT
ncbi:MAG: response regulator [Desulfosarcinaceae bacterium]